MIAMAAQAAAAAASVGGIVCLNDGSRIQYTLETEPVFQVDNDDVVTVRFAIRCNPHGLLTKDRRVFLDVLFIAMDGPLATIEISKAPECQLIRLSDGLIVEADLPSDRIVSASLLESLRAGFVPPPGWLSFRAWWTTLGASG